MVDDGESRKLPLLYALVERSKAWASMKAVEQIADGREDVTDVDD